MAQIRVGVEIHHTGDRTGGAVHRVFFALDPPYNDSRLFIKPSGEVEVFTGVKSHLGARASIGISDGCDHCEKPIGCLQATQVTQSERLADVLCGK